MKKKYNILITGGSSGIGKELVLQLLKKKQKVIFTYFNNYKESKRIKSKFRNDNCIIFKLDLNNHNEIKKKIKDLKKKIKKIDFVILNALNPVKRISFKKLQMKELNKNIKINYIGNYIIIKSIISFFNKKYAKINFIHISSKVVQNGGWKLAHYAPMKAAIDNLFLCLSREYKKQINFFSIKIGSTDTPGFRYGNHAKSNIVKASTRAKKIISLIK